MKKIVGIWGAGLSGLIAANAFQDATIYESRPASADGEHKALLRFRTPAVGEFLGIPFRRVRVHKGIWLEGRFVDPSIRVANMYSRKVIGKLADRSIWSLEPVDRYIAPEDLVGQLIERYAHRIFWQHKIEALPDRAHGNTAYISTLPMHVMHRLASEWDEKNVQSTFERMPLQPFERQNITVNRYRLREPADVHQTVYFPGPETNVYRASITGDMLIVESMGELQSGALPIACEAFDLHATDSSLENLGASSQERGKIAPIDEGWRREFVYQLSQRHNVYSLGRFATWRNILLDDVLQDVNVIRRLLNADAYSAVQHAAG